MSFSGTVQTKCRHKPKPTKDELMAAVDQCYLTTSEVYSEALCKCIPACACGIVHMCLGHAGV